MSIDTKDWTVPILAEFVERQRKADIERLDSRYAANQLAITTALAAADKRLDTISSYSQAVEARADGTMSRAEIDAQLNPIRDAIQSYGKTNWTLIIGSIGSALAVIGAVCLLIGLQISVAISPQVVAVAQLSTEQAAINGRIVTNAAAEHQDEINIRTLQQSASESRQDRLTINERIASMQLGINDDRTARVTAEARFNAMLTEIETQFCAADSLRNMIRADDLRMFSLLWSKTHPGENPYPTDNVYPIVCNRTPPR